VIGGTPAQSLGTPAEQQPGHIAEVVHGIAHQRQGAEGDTDRQLQAGKAAVEQDAPAEGGGRTRPVLVLARMRLALDVHRRVGRCAAAGACTGTGAASAVIVVMGSHPGAGSGQAPRPLVDGRPLRGIRFS